MAEIVIMGAGLGGVIMAYEMKDQMRREDKLTVVTKDPVYHFVPSTPWVAVNWRTREAIEVDLAPTFARRGIAFQAVARHQALAGGEPDYSGNALIGGREFWISGWKKAGKNGTFLSLSFKPKQAQTGRDADVPF